MTAPPAPSPGASALVHSLGQDCTWQNGLTVSVLAVRRDDSDAGGQGQAGYSVALRISNEAPVGYATDALQVGMSVEPNDQAAVPDDHLALGADLAGKVASPGQTITGSYGFRLPSSAASDQVTVKVQPSPVDQPCVIRGTAEPAAAS